MGKQRGAGYGTGRFDGVFTGSEIEVGSAHVVLLLKWCFFCELLSACRPKAGLLQRRAFRCSSLWMASGLIGGNGLRRGKAAGFLLFPFPTPSAPYPLCRAEAPVSVFGSFPRFWRCGQSNYPHLYTTDAPTFLMLCFHG